MIEIDLLPESLRRGAGTHPAGAFSSLGGRNVLLTLALWGSVLIVPPAVLSLWWTQHAEARRLDARVAAASVDSARLAGLRAASDSLAERFREIGERIALVERLDRDRFAWPHMLDEISRALPSFAWLISLRQLSPPPALAVELQGVAANPLAITQFVHGLGASDHIADVKIIGSQQQGLDPGDVSRQAFTLILQFADETGVGRVAPIVAANGGQH